MRELRLEATGGVRLRVRAWEGHGKTPFLLVHGLASNAQMWDGVAGRLAEFGHTVAALDQRGHGLSDKPDEGYDFPTVAADLVRVIDALGLDRPVAAGQSWGGNVVLELADRHADQVRGVVCIDGGTIELSRRFSSWEDCAAALAPPKSEGVPRARVERMIRAMHPDWPESGIEGALANFEVRRDGTVAPWLTFERHMTILRHLYDHRPSQLYSRLTVPVMLALADTGDEAWTKAKRASVAAAVGRIPVASTRWFRSDHDIHAQHPFELAEALHDAVEEAFFG